MKVAKLIAALALACTSVCADAAPYLFDVSGAYNVRFELDSDSIPTVVDDNRFEIHDVDAMLGGSTQKLDVVSFFADVSNGGFNIWNQGDVVFDSTGPVLFTGTTETPTFLTGTFRLFAVGADQTLPAAYSLTVSAVPEPAAWLTMILGFGMTGLVLRRRKTGTALPMPGTLA